MNYEIVNLQEKTVVGISLRTNNSDPNMQQNIGGLWQSYFEKVYAQIPHKANDKCIGLYSNYENNHLGDYDVTVCCEVVGTDNLPEGVVIRTISAGKYAKFVVKGNMQKAVGEFWLKLWNIDLDRKFDCDFEEYQSGGDMDNAEIHIYISIK